MSIKDKIKSAKTDSWLAEGLTEEEIKEIIQSAKAETYKDMLNSLLVTGHSFLHKEVSA